jgi:hypothetical protein
MFKNKFSGSNDGSNEPDILFGIDIGMCCTPTLPTKFHRLPANSLTSDTKVAYAKREDGKYDGVRDFRNWTNLGADNNNKTALVPTIIAYENDHNLQDDSPAYIGFPDKYQKADKDLEVYEWFKEHFPGNLPRAGNEAGTMVRPPSFTNPSNTDTMILYLRFLEKIYLTIKSESRLLWPGLDWDDAHIEFIFSVPATWNRLTETLDNITQSFRAIAKEAGFGHDDPKHSISVGLTEPEAAAAFCLTEHSDKHHLEVCCPHSVLNQQTYTG